MTNRVSIGPAQRKAGGHVKQARNHMQQGVVARSMAGEVRERAADLVALEAHALQVHQRRIQGRAAAADGRDAAAGAQQSVAHHLSAREQTDTAGRFVSDTAMRWKELNQRVNGVSVEQAQARELTLFTRLDGIAREGLAYPAVGETQGAEVAQMHSAARSLGLPTPESGIENRRFRSETLEKRPQQNGAGR